MDNLRIYITTVLLSVLCINNSIAHVNLISPEGGETFAPGAVITISWQEEQTHDPIDFDLHFSSDGGVTWQDIASLNLDQFEYQWTLPNILTEKGKIRVVQDNEGMDYTDISPNFRISFSGIVTAVNDPVDAVPSESFFNYPNPFQSETTIEFTLSQYNHVSLEIYNSQGIKMAALMDEILPAGTYSTPWNARGTSPGLYLGMVRVGTLMETRKLIKLR